MSSKRVFWIYDFMADRDFNPKQGEWFPLMHQLVDNLILIGLSATEWQLIMLIMRYAYSYQRPHADLRWKFIIERTGLGDGTISKALAKLKGRNIINTFPQERKLGTRYRINSKISTWKTLSHRKDFPGGKQTLSPGKVHLLRKSIKKKRIYSEAKKILDRLNELSGKNFKHLPASLDPIAARLNEGFSTEDCFQVLQNKWEDKDFNVKYFRPVTLFRKSLFEGYLNETGSKLKISEMTASQRKAYKTAQAAYNLIKKELDNGAGAKN